jgi:hypothetical protein
LNGFNKKAKIKKNSKTTNVSLNRKGTKRENRCQQKGRKERKT